MNNDLISRKALKEAIRKRLCISSLQYLTEQEKIIVDEIDNASPVEAPTELCKGCRFLQDCETCEEKLRPQGEWLELKTNPPFLDHKFYICSLCNREIDVILPEGSLNDYPYCHCGAKMEVER